ncbi:MAG TPA: hypothetical protein DCY13_05965 [Verrucomicrobiales bacterium]|nr:hypothetical protein [Verrucomicrobiales bacterium]
MFAVFGIQRGATIVGEFACRLDFEKAPRTVANFVGLAEGGLPYVDFRRGHVERRQFYDGTKFHRVVAGFVIQGGSPNGLGSDGPGYTFRDEFDPALRHSRAGMLSMANSGLHSNGSQFFVTLAATPWLDDVHSVFGEVIEGMNVVTNVQQGDVIASVIIVRNGEPAQTFDVSAQGLPRVDDAIPRLQKTAGSFQLGYTQPANSEFFVFHSAEPAGPWSLLPEKEMHGPLPLSVARDVSSAAAGSDRQFFNVARGQYPDPIHTPPAVVGKRLTLANSSEAGTFALEFSLPTGTSGSFVLTPNGQPPINGTVGTHSWTREAYRGRLVAAMSGLTYRGWPVDQANISFAFDSAGGGFYAGSLINRIGEQAPLKGTFAVANLP